MKTRIIGYLVIDNAADLQQPLGLVFGPHLPPGGLLHWTDGPRFLFPGRAQARAAIQRTEHYRRAYRSSHPDRRSCRILPVAGPA